MHPYQLCPPPPPPPPPLNPPENPDPCPVDERVGVAAARTEAMELDRAEANSILLNIRLS
jgi:hypothetical protein